MVGYSHNIYATVVLVDVSYRQIIVVVHRPLSETDDNSSPPVAGIAPLN